MCLTISRNVPAISHSKKKHSRNFFYFFAASSSSTKRYPKNSCFEAFDGCIIFSKINIFSSLVTTSSGVQHKWSSIREEKRSWFNTWHAEVMRRWLKTISVCWRNKKKLFLKGVFAFKYLCLWAKTMLINLHATYSAKRSVW